MFRNKLFSFCRFTEDENEIVFMGDVGGEGVEGLGGGGIFFLKEFLSGGGGVI